MSDAALPPRPVQASRPPGSSSAAMAKPKPEEFPRSSLASPTSATGGETMNHDQQTINDDTPRRLRTHSLVIAAAIPVLLWFAGGEAQALRSVWSLTLFLVCYMFFCACRFSTAGTRLTTIFFDLSYGVLIAFAAGHLVSDVLGTVIILLVSLLAAGLFGSTLAQHRESSGAEKAAAVAAAATVKTTAIERRDSVVPLFAIFLLGFIAWAAWLVSPVADYSVLAAAINLLSALAALVALSNMCVLLLLNGAIVGDESSTYLPVSWFCFGFMIVMLSYALLGELGGFVVQWLSVVPPTVFLGYCVRIHVSSEHILHTRSHRPLSQLDGHHKTD